MAKRGMDDAGEGTNTTPEATQAAVAARRAREARKAVAKKAQSLKALVVEYVEIGSLRPNAYNPNRQSEHDFELLCRSMEEDGFTQPIIAQRETRTIVDGEHRWRAAGALGMTEIPVVFVDMTPEQMKIATLRHNRARGTEDVTLVGAIIHDLEALGALEWAQDSLMMDDAEVRALLEDVAAPDLLANDEHTEAWRVSAEEKDMTHGSQRESSLTPEALAAARAEEKAMAEAKTEEERQKARQDADIVRVNMVYTGAQAATVKAVLGVKPAIMLLKLCEAIHSGLVLLPPELKQDSAGA